MSYKHQLNVKKRFGQKAAMALLTSLPIIAVLGSTTILSSCGFHLRGYDAPMRFDIAKTAVVIEDERISFPLKLPLTRRLEALGIEVVDGMSLIENADNAQLNGTIADEGSEQIAVINVNNVRFRRYELVGVLTEIRLVLSADVSYETIENGRPVTLTNPIQVERSYQYNEASVSTDDQQGSQIRDWLYDSLARRITDQYVAIALPKVAPAPTNKSAQIEESSATTTIIAPSS
ncbi:hypothetical protein [uncultured Psychrobacter sp.]|uniref:LPS-assembly lipoprotein LptE n=1 Tax=uncultured Psychrobacter sp. TaxID=259303 RepID=UPI0034585D1E